MTGRIILTVLVVVACFVFIGIIEQSVAPNTAADLAVNQLKEDGSREQLRIFEDAQNWLDPVCYVATLGLLWAIWSKPIKTCIAKSKEVESKELEIK